MAKQKRIYTCQQCGHQSQSWMGKCPSCSAWNSLVEEMTSSSAGAAVAKISPALSAAATRALPISQIPLGDGGEVRLRIGIGELDRVLGGGLVTGSLVLLGGDPGVGKSTILLMTLALLTARGIRALYVSAEESARQVRLRAERLGVSSDSLFLLSETDLDSVRAAVEQVRPKVLVLDSVQTLFKASLDGVPGSVGQVRAVAHEAMQISKGLDIATFLVGHVTKEGTLAGPRVLEHLVDTVLYFEGDGGGPLRVMRAHKNRFGSTGEIGLFEMREEGLVEVPDASARLLQERAIGAPGTCVTCTLEGSRPLLVEVQALVGRSTPGNPIRTAVGLDRGRLMMLLAVLGKLGLDLSDRDVFVSVAGGVRINEPGVDLAVAIALHSSVTNTPVPGHLLAFGEVGLVGEVRGVSGPVTRLKEAERHGFKMALIPTSAVYEGAKLDLRTVRLLSEALGGKG